MACPCILVSDDYVWLCLCCCPLPAAVTVYSRDLMWLPDGSELPDETNCRSGVELVDVLHHETYSCIHEFSLTPTN